VIACFPDEGRWAGVLRYARSFFHFYYTDTDDFRLYIPFMGYHNNGEMRAGIQGTLAFSFIIIISTDYDYSS
jgi:hypothetical protein